MTPQEHKSVGEEDTSKDPGAADSATSEFLLRACHDLRSAVRAIRTQADLLLKERAEAPAPRLEEGLRFIVDNAQRIDLFTDGLVGYSIALQIQKGTFRLTSMEVLLRAALAKLRKELRANDATVTYDQLPQVLGDADRLMEVFENLLRNALCHRGPAPPVIHITAARQPEQWLFSLRDNGPGVEAAYLESIFNPFVRLSRRQPGPGLGLTVCRAIVERHGGRIWVESKTGAGTDLFFTLPAD